MATVQEIQSGVIKDQDKDKTESGSFLEDIKVEGADAMSLDRRFFSGATDRPAELRTDINNAIGYKTFQTYYDKYVEDEKRFSSHTFFVEPQPITVSFCMIKVLSHSCYPCSAFPPLCCSTVLLIF